MTSRASSRDPSQEAEDEGDSFLQSESGTDIKCVNCGLVTMNQWLERSCHIFASELSDVFSSILPLLDEYGNFLQISDRMTLSMHIDYMFGANQSEYEYFGEKSFSTHQKNWEEQSDVGKNTEVLDACQESIVSDSDKNPNHTEAQDSRSDI